jgi:hypothetical protein
MEAPSIRRERSHFRLFRGEYWIYLLAGLEIVVASGLFYVHG